MNNLRVRGVNDQHEPSAALLTRLCFVTNCDARLSSRVKDEPVAILTPSTPSKGSTSLVQLHADPARWFPLSGTPQHLTIAVVPTYDKRLWTSPSSMPGGGALTPTQPTIGGSLCPSPTHLLSHHQATPTPTPAPPNYFESVKYSM
ncbi:hypothetical protein E2C01_009089 [Portunus trituberculatus]|uniref:Uncharacterized protein n=1 Tax=Portunus trituberculatus TaxID=210409 RepID=A0A5B7D3Z7_PORTR|nr:hypothetical protein [Portunus trituberculatus]